MNPLFLFVLLLLLFLFFLFLLLPIRHYRRLCTLAYTFWRQREHPPTCFQPDIILVLGGDRHRELTAVRLYSQQTLDPSILALSSSSSSTTTTTTSFAFTHQQGMAQQEGILIDYARTPLLVSSGAIGPEDLPPSSSPLIRFDRQAVCTLTNFTSLVASFEAQKIQRVLVITSSFHLPRAMDVGRLVLGSAGIEVRGLGIHAAKQTGEKEMLVVNEGWVRRGRDVLRAWLWLLGFGEGRGVVGWVHPTRRRGE